MVGMNLRMGVDRRAAWKLDCPGWAGFGLRGLRTRLTVDGETLATVSVDEYPQGAARRARAWRLRFPRNVQVFCELHKVPDGLRLAARLEYSGSAPCVLNAVQLLGTDEATPDRAVSFGREPSQIMVLEQGNYWGHVRPLAVEAQPKEIGQAGEPGSPLKRQNRCSSFVTLFHDRRTRHAFLAGVESSERWEGVFRLEQETDGTVLGWYVQFDGGDLRILPGESIAFEPVLFLVGRDPWRLLEQYAERVAARHPVRAPAQPPVSWCSWYPYRLGVTQERLLETAEIAARRLKPLGLSIIEADLGWERGQLPSTFTENAQFSKGLKWLAGRLREKGFDLGVWKGAYSISEFDPLVKAHPEWLIQGEDGTPLVVWDEWFWEPHGKVFILDLSHPGARAWIRKNIAALHAKGVRYFKFDFIGLAGDARAKRRHDPRMVTGAGTEAARQMAQGICDAAPDSWILNCGGPEMPGTGHMPLLYVCNDTGNTGFLKPAFQRDNTQALACHLYKNRRWGWIQPSCLCVGLPGTLEEARARATIAFLSGGQIDISDTLTTLPEERWKLLAATLPPLGLSARPVDLFDPVGFSREYDYGGTTQGKAKMGKSLQESHPGSVWHLHLRNDWDEWDLVAFYAFDSTETQAQPQVNRFSVPLAALHLDARRKWTAFEFWDQVPLGGLPGGRRNLRGYRHPGDFQDLLVGADPRRLDVLFFGPACKLICIRRQRPHPWVTGTSFHQSCGWELARVQWNAARRELSGRLLRPAGHQGQIVIDAAGVRPVAARAGGQPAPLIPAAKGCYALPALTTRDTTEWRVRFER